MKTLESRKRIRRVIYSLPSLIVLVIITFLLVRGAVRVILKERELSGQSRELERKATALTAREQMLEADIARLQTEEGIKEEIKERFSVAPEGQRVAVIVDDNSRASSSGVIILPWYKKIWNAIIPPYERP